MKTFKSDGKNTGVHPIPQHRLVSSAVLLWNRGTGCALRS